MKRTVFKKAKLAAAIALTSSTLVMTGCLVEGDDSESISQVDASASNNGVSTNTPISSVTGKVSDTNGNPIVGVSVYLAGKSTVTDSGGHYIFEGIPVTGIVANGESYLGSMLNVSIEPSAQYLGATVQVSPKAVIDNGRSDQGTYEETESNSTNRFVDGFIASAGTAVLPAVGETGSIVTGVLRDKDTHEAISNQVINLEFLNVNSSAHAGGNDVVSISTTSFPTTTAADGSFEIIGVANDSNLKFVAGGYVVDSITANGVENMAAVVSTNDEIERIHVGNVYVVSIPNADDKAPYVVAIDEAVVNASRAKLHDDVTNVLTIRFSETLNVDGIDENSIKLFDLDLGEDGQYISDFSVAVGEDAKSITITKNDGNFSAGHKVDIYLLKVDFQDTAANILEFKEDNDVVKYDDPGVTSTGPGQWKTTDYLNLKVEIYQEVNDDAAIVTNEAQLAVDDSSARELTLLDQASIVFSDVDMEENDSNEIVIDQLNASEAQSRIIDLIKASQTAAELDDAGIIFDSETGIPKTINLMVGVNTNLEANDVVRVNVARIKFTASNADEYEYSLSRGTDTLDIDATIDTVSSPLAEINADNLIVAEDGVDVVFTLSGVKPGDVLTITSIDGLGHKGASKQIILRDNVAVTTGLQNSYGESEGEGDLGSSSTTIGQVFGDGGELANPDAQSLIGLPLLNINSGMLADQFNTTHDAVLDSLYEENAKNEGGDQFYTEGTYDATAYEKWIKNTSRTIAISFTENLAWANGATAPVTEVEGLSDWTILNDVRLNSEEEEIQSDIVAFSAANIFDLANVSGQAQSVIDFTNTIEDAAGNVATATADAKVVVFDAMPPMVTKAEYLGGSLVIEFNEAIKFTDGNATSESELVEIASIAGFPLNLSKGAIDTFNEKEAAERMRLEMNFNKEAATEGGLSIINRNIVFPTASQYLEEDDTVATGASGHAELDFSLIQDNYGNTWAKDFASIDSIPTFAVIDLVGDMVTKSKQGVNFIGGETEFTVVYKFSHPVTLENVKGQAAADLFELTSNADIIATDDSYIVLSNDDKTVTVNIMLDAPLLIGDEFKFQDGVSSLWDSSTTAESATTTIVVN